MANNLLDKASIILTPTAYDNGKALCVKPSDGSGDFDFSRNSAATRVNAQGLVENVQILSSNLVQNPSFSEEGVQEVSNGSFSNGSTDWTLGGEVTIGDNLAHFESNTNTYSYIRQDIGSLTTKTYKIQLEVKNYVSGAVQVAFSGASPIAQNLNVSSDGVYTAYLTPNANGDDFEVSREFNGGNFNFDITNISVKEVGQNWNLVSANASIGENKLIANSVVTENIATQSGVVPISKPIILKFDLILNSGGFRVLAGSGGTATNITTSGTYTLYETSGTGGTLTLQSRFGSFDGSVTNLSIIEITTDTNLPRINYEGFSYQDALGSEEVVNGTFDDGTNNWSSLYGATISVVDSQLEITGAANGGGRCSQGITTTIGASYLLKATITNVNSNGITIKISQNSNLDGAYFNSATNTTTNPVEVTHTFIATSTTTYIGTNQAGSAYSTAFLDNVSVKEYLGQEVVPDSGCGSWLFEPQSTNLVPYSEDFSQWSVIGTPTITSNYGISPDGTQNSTRIQFNNSDRIYESVSVSGDITYSVYLKGVGEVRLRDNAGIYTLDITLTDQWVRYEYSFNGTITNVQIQQSVGTSDLEIWGAQVEALSYPTSMIPTSGSTVTRNQDVCNNGGSLATINSTEGVLYAEIAINQNDNGTFRLISMTDASDSVRIGFGKKDNDDRWFIKILIGSLNITSQVFYFQEGFQKIAIRYKSGDSGVYINGTKVITNTSNYVNTFIIDNVSFDYNGNSSLPFFGKTKALAVFPYLTDSELQSLTTI